jgi:uncharacterized protein
MFDGFEFDGAKDAANMAKHGLSFRDFSGFDTPAAIIVDGRSDYGEVRMRAFGRIDGKGYMIAFTKRENVTRLISFRRAHEKEMRRYETSEDRI